MAIGFFFFVFGQITCIAQNSHFCNSCQQFIIETNRLFDEGAYLLVNDLIENVDVNSCNSGQLRDIGILKTLSESYIAILSDADLMLSEFAIGAPYSIAGTSAAEFATQEKLKNSQWLEALHWFELPHFYYSIEIEDDAWTLAHGYTLFQLARYESAIAVLDKVAKSTPRYYYPSRYYMALAYANMEALDVAVTYFEEIADYPMYSDEAPFYIAQIYFELEDYEKVLLTAEKYASKSNLNPEFYRLAGHSANALEDCKNTTSYLARYISLSNNVVPQDYYVKALCEYKSDNLEAAGQSFQSISHIEDQYGQLANYYLGDIFFKKGDKVSARNAFRRAHELGQDSIIAHQSYFYFGKLSAELRYDRDAIITLRSIQEGSPYYTEAQEIMSDILINTKDYESAIQTLSTINNKSAILLKAEQTILYNYALSLINNGDVTQAQELLVGLSSQKYDKHAQIMSNFWLGEIAYDNNAFEDAIKYFSAFGKAANGDVYDSYKGQAWYSLGYAQLRLQDIKAAINSFEMALDFQLQVGEEYDATLRLGDLYFKINEYDNAQKQYQTVLENYPGLRKDYALYQKAIIEGLNQDFVKKIITLEELIDNYTESAYLDDAIYETGVTLQTLGKPKEALSSFRFLIDEFENESSLVIPSYLRLGLISYNQGDIQQASKYYKQVFNHFPNAPQKEEALTALKEIYVNDLTQPDEYLKILETYGDNKVDDPSRDSITYYAAKRQFELENHQRATEAFLQYIKTFEDGIFNTEAHYELAEAALILEQYTLALVHYELVCQRQVRALSDACFKAAEIAYHSEKDFKRALPLYESSSRFTESEDIKEKAIMGLLRSAYETENDSIQYEAALKALTFEKLSANDEAFVHYCLGKARLERGDSAIAVNDFNFVIKHSSASMAAESRYLIAEIYFFKNELDVAEKLCDQANKENVNHPYWIAKGLILYSDILLKLGDLYNAKAALDAVIANASQYQELVTEAELKKQAIVQLLNKENKLNPKP